MGEPISPSANELEGLPQSGLAGLIAKGRAQGSLTTGDVFDALSDDVEPSPGQLDAIYNHIRASGIELVDEIAADLASGSRRRSGPVAGRRRRGPGRSRSRFP